MQRHEGIPARQTRIVATIGLCPEADFATFLGKLGEAGVDVLRLNMSHCDRGYAKETEILAWANQPTPPGQAPRVAIMADLQGPKVRIGQVGEAGLELQEGATVVLLPEGASYVSAMQGAETPVMIPVPEPTGSALVAGLAELWRTKPSVRPAILFGDGDIIVEADGLGPQHVTARVVAGGTLRSKKGLTVRELDLDLDPFPEKDQRDLRFCLDHGVDYVALSFVRTPADLQRVRQFMADHLAGQGEAALPRLIAKIETLSAVEHIDAILEASDGVMVARGDLGLQLGFDAVPGVQKQLVLAARRQGKPCIIATQMLESMIANPVPTRAEAADVFNAILDGGDAVMMSGETSVGTRPYLVVDTMDGIVRKAEAYRAQDRANRPPLRLPPIGPATHIERINGEFAHMAARLAEQLPAFAIVCFTRSGLTPERISRFRPPVPVLAFCATDRVARRCLLYWGVHPVVLPGFDTSRDRLGTMVARAREILQKRYGMSRGDPLVVTAGVDWPKGGTNTLQVRIEDHSEVDLDMQVDTLN